MIFRVDSVDRTKLESSRGVQQGDAVEPAPVCLPLRPVLTRVREEYESQALKSYAYLDALSLPTRYHPGRCEWCPSSSES